MSTALLIPLWADLLAVGVGALQGALFAAQFRDRRLDWLGVAIIGIVVGFGGGLLRDLLLDVPLAPLQSNWYVIVATGAALLGMLLERLFSRLSRLITVLDALTIGLFGAIGTAKALAVGLPEVAAVFVGVLAAVGGSILRDMLLNLPIALMHVGSLYAVAAAAGSGAVAVLLAFGVDVPLAGTIGVVATLGVRIASVLFGWSLPEQRSIALPRLPRLPRPRLGRIRNLPPTTGTVSIRTVDRSTGTITVVRTGVEAGAADHRDGRARRIPGASRPRS